MQNDERAFAPSSLRVLSALATRNASGKPNGSPLEMSLRFRSAQKDHFAAPALTTIEPIRKEPSTVFGEYISKIWDDI